MYCSGQIEAAKGRADKFIDSILRLSNIEAIAKYLIGGDRVRSMPASSGFDSRVIGSAVTDVRVMLLPLPLQHVFNLIQSDFTL